MAADIHIYVRYARYSSKAVVMGQNIRGTRWIRKNTMIQANQTYLTIDDEGVEDLVKLIQADELTVEVF